MLAAFPDAVKPLPEVYRPLSGLFPEMQLFPTVRSDYIEALSAGEIRAAIDQHVRTGVPALPAIVVELKNRIGVKTVNGGETQIDWNRTLLHAAVFYLGTTCIARTARQTGVAAWDGNAPEVEILTELMLALNSDGEDLPLLGPDLHDADRVLGQHHMLSVIADQLRYPSAHSLFFIHLMLFLFLHTSRSEQSNQVPEYISRVLLERIIVHRPHPWGLMVTFVELLENDVYSFWRQPFVRAEQEIYMFFLKAQKSIAGWSDSSASDIHVQQIRSDDGSDEAASAIRMDIL